MLLSIQKPEGFCKIVFMEAVLKIFSLCEIGRKHVSGINPFASRNTFAPSYVAGPLKQKI